MTDKGKYYHYVYRTENIVTKKFYIGKHTSKLAFDPDYIGSGQRLLEDVKLLGKDQFKTEVLSYFRTADEALRYEREVVTPELVKNDLCYNKKQGGSSWPSGSDNYSVIKSINKTHQWMGDKNPAKMWSRLGIHPMSNVAPWNNVNSNDRSKLVWTLAEEIISIAKDNPSYGDRKILSTFKKLYNIDISRMPILNIINKWKLGWIPDQDQEWLKFKQDYKVISDE